MEAAERPKNTAAMAVTMLKMRVYCTATSSVTMGFVPKNFASQASFSTLSFEMTS